VSRDDPENSPIFNVTKIAFQCHLIATLFAALLALSTFKADDNACLLLHLLLMQLFAENKCQFGK
jgi:hypothetical protein